MFQSREKVPTKRFFFFFDLLWLDLSSINQKKPQELTKEKQRRREREDKNVSATIDRPTDNDAEDDDDILANDLLGLLHTDITIFFPP